MMTTPSIGTAAEGQAHGVHRGAVGALLVAPAHPPAGGEGGGFGDPDQVEGEVAIEEEREAAMRATLVRRAARLRQIPHESRRDAGRSGPIEGGSPD